MMNCHMEGGDERTNRRKTGWQLKKKSIYLVGPKRAKGPANGIMEDKTLQRIVKRS